MTIPIWVLLAFAFWTLVVLLVTVGAYRWRRILAGRVPIEAFRHDALEGHEDWYRRAMRAHGNCVENLPVYAAIVVAITAARLETPTLDVLAIVLIAARISQTLVHVSFTESTATVSIRFTFFALQVLIMLTMCVLVVAAFVRAGAMPIG